MGKRKKRHRLNITLEDVAELAGVTMTTIYSDVKREKFDKDSLSSIIEYIQRDRGGEGPSKRIAELMI